MADQRDIQFEGFDELVEWIQQFPEVTLPLAEGCMDRSAGIVEGIIEEYPPADAANQPGRTDGEGRPMGYYERGRGEWYPVKHMKTMGGLTKKSEGVRLLGKKKQIQMGVVGYKLIASSETLGRKWYHRVEATQGEIVGMVGNTASYMPEVNGSEQTSVMQARGWKNPDQALDEAEPQIQAEFGRLLDDIQSQFSKG